MTAPIIPLRRGRPLPEPELDRTDPAWRGALAYLRPRRHLDHVADEILSAFLAGARHERLSTEATDAE